MLNNFRKTLRKKFSSHHSGYFFIIKILVVAYLSAREPQVSRYYSEVGSVSAQLFKRTTRATASLRFIINYREATKITQELIHTNHSPVSPSLLYGGRKLSTLQLQPQEMIFARKY